MFRSPLLRDLAHAPGRSGRIDFALERFVWSLLTSLAFHLMPEYDDVLSFFGNPRAFTLDVSLDWNSGKRTDVTHHQGQMRRLVQIDLHRKSVRAGCFDDIGTST